MTTAGTAIHAIEISQGHRTPSRQMYVVRYRGEVILSTTRDPEWEAARVLVGRGLSGRLHTRRAGTSTISFDQNLEKAATLTTSDPNKGRARIGKCLPYPSGDEPADDENDLPMAAE